MSSSPFETVDCVVIGAGVVGLAVARALALAGRVPEAQEEARIFLAGNPNWRIGEQAANSPFRSMSTAQPFIDGWRLAGLPD